VFGVADLATTLYGIGTGVAVETSPIPALVLGSVGLAGLVAWKAVGLAVWYSISRASERVLPGGHPGVVIGLTLYGGYITLQNVLVVW